MIDIILRATLTAAVAQGTPLLLTALGEIMNQRAGVLNLGLDGMMLFGAVTAFISLIASGSLFVAVLVGGVCAALLALIHAFLSITCRVHQVICGLALNIFAAGFSAFVGKDYNGIAAPKVLGKHPHPAAGGHSISRRDLLQPESAGLSFVCSGHCPELCYVPHTDRPEDARLR